jgi:hypothetical protein
MGSNKLLRKLASATSAVADNTTFKELLLEVDEHLSESVTSREYCILYVEKKLKAAIAAGGGCTLSLGLTEDILQHLKKGDQ